MTLGLPLLVGWASALVLAALDGRRRSVCVLALVLGLALLASVLPLAVQVAGGATPAVVAGDWPAEVGIRLRADALSVVFAVGSLVLVVAVLAFETAHGPATRSFPALVLFLATGLVGLFLTADAFDFYVFFELAMISAFALAGYGGGRRESRAASVFVVVNLLGSVLFLGGVAQLYRLTGTLDMAAIARATVDAAPGSVLLAGTLLFLALGLKLGLFPFHYWLPVVYRDSHPAVAALFAGALANVAAYGLLRFGAGVLPGVLPEGRVALLVLGGASVVYGSLQAVHRRDLRDVLAYSAIGQAGYTVLALAVGGPAGLAAATLYSLVNALHKTALFLGAGAVGAGVAPVLLFTGLSVAGLPPSAGFVGKVAMFRLAAGNGDAALLAVLAAGGFLSFVYVLQAWQHGARDREDRDRPPASPHAARLQVALLGLAVLIVGLWPAPLVEWSDRAAAALGRPP